MRIRTDGDHEHRERTIEQAAEFWDCNKTRALMRSAEFSRRIDSRIQEVLEREDLTVAQKREIAETLSVPGTVEYEVEESVRVKR